MILYAILLCLTQLEVLVLVLALLPVFLRRVSNSDTSSSPVPLSPPAASGEARPLHGSSSPHENSVLAGAPDTCDTCAGGLGTWDEERERRERQLRRNMDALMSYDMDVARAAVRRERREDDE